MAVPQGILGALQNSPFANSIRAIPNNNYFAEGLPRADNTELTNVPTMDGSILTEAALVGNRERVDPYKGTRFEGFTGLGNDGYGSISQGPMDRVLSDGFFVNDPRRTTPFPNELGGNLKRLPERGMMDILTSYMNDYSTPEERLQTARGRMMSRDVKSKAENDALMYITQNQGDINQDRLDFLKYRQSLRPEYGTNSATTMEVRPGEISFDEFMKQGKPNSYTGGDGISGYLGISDQPGAGELLNPILKDATGMPDPRGPVDPGFSPQPGMFRPTEINPNFRPGYRPDGMNPIDIYARPQPGMFPQPVETNPNVRPNLPYRPNPNLPFNGNPNMYQRPMRRPFGFGGRRPMNPFMGMGLGMMNPMGMGMFGGFPMRPPMFGGYGGGFGGRPMMGYGLGAANPYGMSPYSNFGRPTPYSQPSYSRPNPYQQPSYNRPNPYSSGMNLRPPSFGGGQPSYTPSQNPNQVYDVNMRPIPGAYADPNPPNIMQQQPQYNNMYQQPQQGGYGGYQQPSGYGNYGQMPNPYQPQQMGNANNFAGYGQQQPAGMF